MTLSIDGLPPLRDVISDYGLRAQKSLGQNFLLDLNLTGKIARQAGDLSNHTILEVGPGPGGLTRALLSQGAKQVIAIERDERCLPALAQIADHYDGRLKVVSGDALAVDLSAQCTGSVKVIANLPYNIGTELLIRWLTPDNWPPFWDSLTLMFQREVAQRIVAAPGSKACGRLSVLAQWRSDASIVMELPPQAFTPAPKVSSAVVHITKCDVPKIDCEQKVLQRVVAAAFNQRRKMLRASLKGLAPDIEAKLERVGIKPTDRAEQITVADFCRLSLEF